MGGHDEAKRDGGWGGGGWKRHTCGEERERSMPVETSPHGTRSRRKFRPPPFSYRKPMMASPLLLLLLLPATLAAPIDIDSAPYNSRSSVATVVSFRCVVEQGRSQDLLSGHSFRAPISAPTTNHPLSFSTFGYPGFRGRSFPPPLTPPGYALTLDSDFCRLASSCNEAGGRLHSGATLHRSRARTVRVSGARSLEECDSFCCEESPGSLASARSKFLPDPTDTAFGLRA